MKYVVALLAGILIGAALFLALLYYNPFATKQGLSPLHVSNARLVDVSFSPVSGEALAVTNNGGAPVKPHPEAIDELWEASIRRTRLLVTTLTEAGGGFAGIGIKFASDSESTRLLNAEVMVDSAWHIWMPDRGSFFIDQTENLWPYLRGVGLPARLSSGDSWRGTWYGITTAGPGALGTGRVTGGSGAFAGVASEATESVSARAWSASQGPVAMTGNLLISLDSVDTAD
jgi:hypothetical protein